MTAGRCGHREGDNWADAARDRCHIRSESMCYSDRPTSRPLAFQGYQFLTGSLSLFRSSNAASCEGGGSTEDVLTSECLWLNN